MDFQLNTETVDSFEVLEAIIDLLGDEVCLAEDPNNPAAAHTLDTLRKRLCAAEDVNNQLQGLVFFERWYLPFNPPAAGPSLEARVIDGIFHGCKTHSMSFATLALQTIQKTTSARLRRAMNVIDALTQYAFVGLPTYISPTNGDPNKPRTLLRIWSDQSVTRYVEGLGFRCTDWEDCERAMSFEELCDKGALTPYSVQAHCEGYNEPSLWISTCDDASWALKYAHKKGMLSNPTCKVAIIDASKLERLNLLWERSSELVRMVGARRWNSQRPNGIKFAWPGHIMVYGTIPTACFVTQFSVGEFVERCRLRGIERNSSFVRPPHELLSLPRVSKGDTAVDALTNRVARIRVKG